MPKIQINIEVPENDCISCVESYVFDSLIGLVCCQFDKAILAQKTGKHQRCEECIKHEVNN